MPHRGETLPRGKDLPKGFKQTKADFPKGGAKRIKCGPRKDNDPGAALTLRGVFRRPGAGLPSVDEHSWNQGSRALSPGCDSALFQRDEVGKGLLIKETAGSGGPGRGSAAGGALPAGLQQQGTRALQRAPWSRSEKGARVQGRENRVSLGTRLSSGRESESPRARGNLSLG